ncbi:MAG: M14-type cytosolic carboxypeptidase [Bacteroidota bacterium]
MKTLPIYVYLTACPLFLFSQTQISFHTDFEGGSLGEVIQVGENHWRCAVAGESDWDNRNRQASWYYFRLDGAKGQSVVLELTNLLGEYNYQSGAHAITSETRPVISYNQSTWRHLTDEEVIWNDEDTELTLTFTPKENVVWIAHQVPYITADLNELLSDYQDHPLLSKKSIGLTPQGRDIWQLTIAKPEVPIDEKKVVWLMARQHSWESGSSWVMEGAIRYLLDSASNDGILDKVTFQLIPMADPDGVVRGGVRFNEFGHDLNRNWDFVIPEEMAEIQAQKKAIAKVASSIDLFVTLHNTERADYIQGPDLPIGKQFYQAMLRWTSFESDEEVREMPESTTLGKAGRMTVNQALWAEYQIPAYLMELKVEKVNKLNGRRLVPEWLALGKGLVKSIAEAVK